MEGGVAGGGGAASATLIREASTPNSKFRNGASSLPPSNGPGSRRVGSTVNRTTTAPTRRIRVAVAPRAVAWACSRWRDRAIPERAWARNGAPMRASVTGSRACTVQVVPVGSTAPSPSGSTIQSTSSRQVRSCSRAQASSTRRWLIRWGLAASSPRSSRPGPSAHRRRASARTARGLASGRDSSTVTTASGSAVASPASPGGVSDRSAAAGGVPEPADSSSLTRVCSVATAASESASCVRRRRTSASSSSTSSRSRSFSRRRSPWLWAAATRHPRMARSMTAASPNRRPSRAGAEGCSRVMGASEGSRGEPRGAIRWGGRCNEGLKSDDRAGRRPQPIR